jgi:hypothetical protein
MKKSINRGEEDMIFFKNQTIYKEITTKIVVYLDHILYIYLKCLPNPVKLQYEARGKLDQYKISFKIIE